MKRSRLLLIPALTFCVAPSVRALDYDMAAVHVEPVESFHVAPPQSALHIQVMQILTAGQPLFQNTNYLALKSHFSPATETDPQRRSVLPMMIAMEDSLKRRDAVKLHHSLLQLAAALEMTPEEAQAVFDKYLEGFSPLSSVANPVQTQPQGAALNELRSLSERSNTSDSSRIERAYEGAKSHSSDSDTAPQTEIDAPVHAVASASGLGGGAGRAASAAASGKALSKAFSALGGGFSGMSPSSEERAESPRVVPAPSATPVSMQEAAWTLSSPSSLNTPALKTAAASHGKRGGMLAGSRLFDNNEASGRIAPAAAPVAASNSFAATEASAVPTISNAGSADASAPQFNAISAQAAERVEASAGRPGKSSKNFLAPVVVPMPSSPAKIEEGSASGDFLSGPRMTFMKVAFPTQDAAQSGAAQTWALASLLALSGAAGLKLFLGKAARRDA